MAVAVERDDHADDLLRWGRSLGKAGFGVLPLWGVKDGVCACPKGADCGSPGKHPHKLAPNGFKNAATDALVVQGWLDKGWRGNLGMVPGERYVVIDVDQPSGWTQLRGLFKTLGVLPPTRHQRTARGGRHLLFKLPADAPVIGNADLGCSNIDVRGEGSGYIVVEPSRGVAGKYLWVDLGAAIAELPAAWVEALAPKSPPDRVPVEAAEYVGTDGGKPYGLAALKRTTADVAAQAEGGRNNRLIKEAYTIGGLVGSGNLDFEAAREALEAAGVDCGLDARVVADTVRRGLEAGVQKPMGPAVTDPPKPKLTVVERPPLVVMDAGADAELLGFMRGPDFVAQLPEDRTPLIGSDGVKLLTKGGYVLIGAPSGSGKTTLTTEFLACAASGRPFLGQAVKRPLRIAVVVNEGAKDEYIADIAAKAACFEGGNGFLDNLLFWDDPWASFKFMQADTAWLTKFRALIEREQIDVVTLDPLSSLGVEAAGAAAEVGKFMDAMTFCGVGTDLGAWVVCHTAKGKDRTGLERIAGTWYTSADYAILLSRSDDDTRTLMHYGKHRFGKKWFHDVAVPRVMETKGFGTMIEVGKGGVTPEQYQLRILNWAVTQTEDWSKTAMENGVEGTSENLREALGVLVAAGKIERVGSGERPKHKLVSAKAEVPDFDDPSESS